jgi:hypothetical protein
VRDLSTFEWLLAVLVAISFAALIAGLLVYVI